MTRHENTGAHTSNTAAGAEAGAEAGGRWRVRLLIEVEVGLSPKQSQLDPEWIFATPRDPNKPLTATPMFFHAMGSRPLG